MFCLILNLVYYNIANGFCFFFQEKIIPQVLVLPGSEKCTLEFIPINFIQNYKLIDLLMFDKSIGTNV
jgi:hypothetical protein